MTQQPTTSMPRQRVGVALSGGFIRSAAHIGVLEVLQEQRIPVDCIAGCSSGVIIAGAYAAGNMDKLKQRLLSGTPRDFRRVIFEPTFPRHGLLRGVRNRVFFEEFVGKKTFADLQIPLFLTATDLKNMREVILKQGLVSPAMQACVAVPGMFVPVELNGMQLVDGGNFNLIPSKTLYDHGADYVIAVDCSQPPNVFTRFLSNYKNVLNRHKLSIQRRSDRLHTLHIFQLMWRAVVLSASQIENFYHHAYRYDTRIRPDVGHVKRMNVQMVKQCIAAGREAALTLVPKIKKDLGLG